MTQLDNPHVKRLYERISNASNETIAEKIACNVPLGKTASPKKKYKWAQDICSSLEESFDESTIKDIRMSCACGPSKGSMVGIKKIYDASGSLLEFARQYNEADLGSAIEIEGEKILFSYPACYCSVVNKIDDAISKTWCYCTLGYTKKMFEYVFGCEVKVKLLNSIKTGGEKCLMEVERV